MCVRRASVPHQTVALFILIGGLPAIPIWARSGEPPQIVTPVSTAIGASLSDELIHVAFAWIKRQPDADTGSSDSAALFVYRGQDGLFEVELCKPFKRVIPPTPDHLSKGCASLVARVRGSSTNEQPPYDAIRDHLRRVEPVKLRASGSTDESEGGATTTPKSGSANENRSSLLKGLGSNGPSFDFMLLPERLVELREEDLGPEDMAPYGVGAELRALGQVLSQENGMLEERWSITTGESSADGPQSVYLSGHLVLFEGGGESESAAARMDDTILELVQLLRDTSVTGKAPIAVTAAGLEEACKDVASLLEGLESLSLLSTDGRLARSTLTKRVIDQLERRPALPRTLTGVLENSSLRPVTVYLRTSSDFVPLGQPLKRLTLEPCSRRDIEFDQKYFELKLVEDAFISEAFGLLVELAGDDPVKPVPVEFRVNDDGRTVTISLQPSSGGFRLRLQELTSGAHRLSVLSLVAFLLLVVVGSLVWFARSWCLFPHGGESGTGLAAGEEAREGRTAHQELGASPDGFSARNRVSGAWTLVYEKGKSIYSKLPLFERREQRRRLERIRSSYRLELCRAGGESDVGDSCKLLEAVRASPLSEVMRSDVSLWRKLQDYPEFDTVGQQEEERVRSELLRIVEEESLVDSALATVVAVPTPNGRPLADKVASNASELRSAYPDILTDNTAGLKEFLFHKDDWSRETISTIVPTLGVPGTPGEILEKFLNMGQIQNLKAFNRNKRSLLLARQAASESFNDALRNPRLWKALKDLSIEVPAPVPNAATDVVALNRCMIESAFLDRHRVRLKHSPQAKARVEALRGGPGEAGWLRRLTAKEVRRLLIRIRTGADAMSVRLRVVIARGPNGDILQMPGSVKPDPECVRSILDRLNTLILDESAWPQVIEGLALRMTTKGLLGDRSNLSTHQRIKLRRYVVEDLCGGAVVTLRNGEELPPPVAFEGFDTHEVSTSPSRGIEGAPDARHVFRAEPDDRDSGELPTRVSTPQGELGEAYNQLRSAEQELREVRERLGEEASRAASLNERNLGLAMDVESLKEKVAERERALAVQEKTIDSLTKAFGIQKADSASDPTDAVRRRLDHFTELAVRNHEKIRRLLGRGGLERTLDPSRSELGLVLIDGLQRLEELELLEEIRAEAPEFFQFRGLLGRISGELWALARQPGGYQGLLGGTQATPIEVAERSDAAVAAIEEHWRGALEGRLANKGRAAEQLARELRRELLRAIDQSAVWKALTSILRIAQIAEVYCRPSKEPEAADLYGATGRLRQAITELHRELDRLGMKLAPLRLFEPPPADWEFEAHSGGPPLIWGSPKLKKLSLDLYRSRQEEDLYDVVVDVTTWGFRCPDFPDFGKGIIGYRAATWRQE